VYSAAPIVLELPTPAGAASAPRAVRSRASARLVARGSILAISLLRFHVPSSPNALVSEPHRAGRKNTASRRDCERKFFFQPSSGPLPAASENSPLVSPPRCELMVWVSVSQTLLEQPSSCCAPARSPMRVPRVGLRTTYRSISRNGWVMP
jgi:hypothetical protein